MNPGLFIPVLSSVITAAASVIVTYFINKKSSREKLAREVSLLTTHLEGEKSKKVEWENKFYALKNENEDNKKTIDKLQIIKDKYEKTVEKLQSSRVIRTLSQPVILMGTRGVGKTSLVLQLHASWVNTKLTASADHKSYQVPIYDYTEKTLTPHFANEEIRVNLDTHLVLELHDFPGELRSQTQIKDIVLEQAQALRNSTNSDLGVVLICMFNAAEAETGISAETESYFNGDLFKQIRSFVTGSQVSVDRLIYVFNHYDKLKKLKPGMDGLALRHFCLSKFSRIFSDLNRICNHEKICEVFTVLGGDDFATENCGEAMVKGECARKFVSFFVDGVKVKELFPESASNHALKYQQ